MQVGGTTLVAADLVVSPRTALVMGDRHVAVESLTFIAPQ